MTSESLNSQFDPFLLAPAGKNYLWGGCRLNDDFSKNINMNPLAETWECSTHPDGLSMVASGKFYGRTLMDVLEEHPEFLGSGQYRNDKADKELPILVKLIDAKKDLSIQVHPDDAYAFEKEHGQKGKTEMWYVIDADRDTTIVYGFRHDITLQMLRESLQKGDIEKYLQKVPIQKDDIFFIEPGTVHAIGAGALIAEIQENSNLTYRLYDYNRKDSKGRTRELHIDKALDIINMDGGSEIKQPLRIFRYQQGYSSEFLYRCKYFEVHRILINTEQCRKLVCYRTDPVSFHVLLCIEGCGNIIAENGETTNFFKGDCIFFPANSKSVTLHGWAKFLDIKS